MKNQRLTIAYLFVLIPLFSFAQVNPFLKKYAGVYHRLNFGEETPTATTEKVTFTMDGNWASTSFPVDDNGVVAKIAVKKLGKWKASDGLVIMSITEKGATVEEEYQLEDGMFMGNNTYMIKVFVSNPIFITKYAGKYHLIYGNEDAPHDYTPTITFKADGKFTQETPTTDLTTGAISKTPTLEQGTWKAQDGLMLVTFDTEGKVRTSEFRMTNGVFTDRVGSSLKKVVPPPPPGLYWGKYAGTYHMVGEGQPVTNTSSKYVLKPDGTGTWSFYTQLDDQGTVSATPTVVKGTWKASEGIIQLYFSPEGSGGDHGGDLLTDFKLENGVFRAEGVVLKKFTPPTPVKK